jgi:transposase
VTDKPQGQCLARLVQPEAGPSPVYPPPAYAPDLNPAQGIWSLLKRSVANFAAADLDGLVRTIKRKLKKLQYRAHPIHDCLGATSLTI